MQKSKDIIGLKSRIILQLWQIRITMGTSTGFGKILGRMSDSATGSRGY